MSDIRNVFISYARKDGADEAERLYNDLKARGITAWRDTRDLDPYADFGGEIEKAIKWASHVAVCITPDVDREDSFVRREIAFALVLKKPIIPLMFPGAVCPPITIINHTYIKFTDWDTGFAALLERLKNSGVEEITPQTRREMELAYLQAIGQRYDHWRDLYTDLAASAHIETPKVKLKGGAAARYLNMQHDIFKSISHDLEDDRSKTVKVQSLDELRDGIREYKRVALIGDPGAGKTTTLERLAYELATEAAEHDDHPLPLFVRLGAYNGGDFDDFIEESFGGLALRDYLPKGIFLLLDGLNEMQPEHAPQVDVWLRAHSDLPVIVTCRKLDYVGHKLPLQRIDVAPLDVRRIHLFLGNYLENNDRDRLFWALSGTPTRESWEWFQREVPEATFDDFWFGYQEPGNYWDPEQKQLKAVREMLADQGKLPGMLGVVSNPFLLFVTVQIYTRSGEPPANRGRLFDQFVTLLMDQRGRSAARTSSWIDERIQRKGLAVLAYQMQAEQTGTSVDVDWACRAIQETLPGEDAKQILYLAASASIIEHGKNVRFTHQLLQEFFAAHEMGEDIRRGVPATKYWPDERWWESTVWDETILLLADMGDESSSIVHWLSGVNPTLAYRCVTESGVPCSENVLQLLYNPSIPPLPIYKQGDEIDRWRETLPRITPLARAEWGHILATRDDIRRGVGLRSDRLPDIDWVEIPARPFLMGSTNEHVAELKAKYDWDWLENEKPQHLVDLPTFYMARYPITYTQYEVFINDGGYSKQDYWTDAGWDWKDDTNEPRYWNDPQWHIGNHPVVGVAWYEAYAFTQWLTAKIGIEIRLPSESEWEKAARGSDGRIYPWGNEYVPGYANVDETDPQINVGPYYIRHTTAVGMYLQGASPYGVLDMSGNTWEWCVTKWRETYNGLENNNPEGTSARVLRGGSLDDYVYSTRCAYRNGGLPRYRRYLISFRVVCSAPI